MKTRSSNLNVVSPKIAQLAFNWPLGNYGKLLACRTLDKRCIGLKRVIFNAKCSFFRISWLEKFLPIDE